MKYPRVIGFLISPVTGRLLTYEQLPPLDKGEIWIGHVYNQKAVPSLKLIDLRIDVNSLIKEVDNIASLPFILKTPSNLIPNAQALNGLGSGIAKIVNGGVFAIATANTDYITPEYLTEQLSNYVLISEFPALFDANYAPAIAASLAAYTTSVVTPEIASALALYNTTVIIPETAASIAAALVTYTSVTVDPHIQTAIDGLTLNLSGVVTASGLLNTTINTSFAPDPVFTGGAITIPIGSSSERPINPTPGMLRFNNELHAFEQWDNSGLWKVPLTGLLGAVNQISVQPVAGQHDKWSIGIVDNPYFHGTGYLRIPTGNTSERPSDPIIGMERFNTTLGVKEQYNGSSWIHDTFGTVISITAGQGLAGGTITESGTISIPNDPIMPGSGAMTIPRGTTAERPSSPFVGMVRFNIDTGKYEKYNGSSWQNDSTGDGTVTSITINKSGNGININSSSPITTSGVRVLSLKDSLEDLGNLTEAGFPVFTENVDPVVGNYVSRTIVGGEGITVTNGNGVNGNPTISVTDSSNVNYTGDVKQSIRTSDHGHWLKWENRRTLSRTTYTELWDLATANSNALINTGMFGTGDGSTTFTMGDILGRSIGIAGQGTHLTNRVLGSRIGAEIITEVPNHKHDITHRHGISSSDIVGFFYSSSGSYMDHGAPGGSGPNPVNTSSSSGNMRYKDTAFYSGQTHTDYGGNATEPWVDIMNPTVYFNLFIYCKTS